MDGPPRRRRPGRSMDRAVVAAMAAHVGRAVPMGAVTASSACSAPGTTRCSSTHRRSRRPSRPGMRVVFKASESGAALRREAAGEPRRSRGSRGAGRRRAGRARRLAAPWSNRRSTRRCSPGGSRTAGRCWPPWAAGASRPWPSSPGSIRRSSCPTRPSNRPVRCLTWAAFVGCGQTCVAVKRVYVVGDPGPWADALAASARALRVGDPSAPGIDVGPDDLGEGARATPRHDRGGEVPRAPRCWPAAGPSTSDGWFYPPTVLLADSRRRRMPWPARSVRSWSSAASPTAPRPCAPPIAARSRCRPASGAATPGRPRTWRASSRRAWSPSTTP